MSWQPNLAPIPQDFLNVLNDEEDFFDEEDGEIEEVEDQLDITNMPVIIEGQEGFLDGTPGEAPKLTVTSSDSEAEDAEWEQAQRIIEHAISPLISHVRSPVPVSPGSGASIPAGAGSPIPGTSGMSDAADLSRFRIQVMDSVPSARISRGRASTRGRGRGRGRARIVRMRRDERNWERGELLKEIYVNDDDLPPVLRKQIHRHLATSRRNERRSMNVEENEDDEFGINDLNEGFEWRGMDAWRGMKEFFLPESTGPTRVFENAYDAMHAIWTDDIINDIVHQSNRYAQSKLVPMRAQFARDWHETNRDEVWVLFAFWMMLGIIRMPSIKSCFTTLPLLKTDIFRFLFTETRYCNLNAAFHLAKMNNPNDPLNPMGRLLEHLNTKFKELYRLDQNISIDESLTLWKGPVGFKQYIKTKSARFGIKTYQLCESGTGYMWSFFVYVGRATGSGSLPSSVSTVLRLIQPLLDLGHTLFMDNWFNSPNLARWLKRRKTDCVGTLIATRKHVPETVKHCPLREGQFIARASDDVMVVALHDRKRVTCLSTYHDVSQVRKEARPGHAAQFKLQLVDDYNQAMGSVDRLDQMLEAYLFERKQCLKWNKILFKRLLNISIQNLRILVEKSTNSKIDALAFCLMLVQEIINRHLPNVPHRHSALSTRNPTFPLNRLTERHFLRRITITDEMRQNIVHRTSLGRRICVWCTHNGRNRSRTVYECAECRLPLCLENCFRQFHTTP